MWTGDYAERGEAPILNLEALGLRCAQLSEAHLIEDRQLRNPPICESSSLVARHKLEEHLNNEEQVGYRPSNVWLHCISVPDGVKVHDQGRNVYVLGIWLVSIEDPKRTRFVHVYLDEEVSNKELALAQLGELLGYLKGKYGLNFGRESAGGSFYFTR